MQNRTAAVIITILAVFLLFFPGLGGICWGLIVLLDAVFGFGVLTGDAGVYLINILVGICGGMFLIVLTIIIAFLVLRKRKTIAPSPVPPPPDEPIPPTI